MTGVTLGRAVGAGLAPAAGMGGAAPEGGFGGSDIRSGAATVEEDAW